MCTITYCESMYNYLMFLLLLLALAICRYFMVYYARVDAGKKQTSIQEKHTLKGHNMQHSGHIGQHFPN